MLNLKRMVCMLLTAGMFTTALPVQALAASDYQYITNISLKVTWMQEMRSTAVTV